MSDSLCYLCLGGPGTVTVGGYGFSVCSRCWSSATRGWRPETEAAIFKALQKAGLLIPDRNDLGRLPREYAPPGDLYL